MKAFARRHQSILIVLIAVASCVRIFVCLQHNPMDYLWSDPLRHWVNGGRFPENSYFGASDPIGFQAYVFFLRGITRDNRILVGLVSGLLSVIMPWTYYRAARNFGMARTPALWVWTLIAWTPSLFTIYHYMMMETLLLVLDGLALWATARYLRKGGADAFRDSVVAWTLACLTKPTVIPLAGVCVLWSCWKRRPSLRSLAVSAALVLVLLLPEAIRSKVELGFVAPFGNPWLTKIQHRSGSKTTELYFRGHAQPDDFDHYFFVSPTCLMQPLAPFSSWRMRRAYGDSSIRIRASFKNGAQDWKNAYASLDPSWADWLDQWKENIIVFFFAPSWPESASDKWDSQLNFVTRWMWAPLIVVVLGWNAYRFLKGRIELLPVAVTLFTLFLAFQNVATAEGRYRKPLEPVLLMNLMWLVSRDANRNDSEPESSASSIRRANP